MFKIAIDAGHGMYTAGKQCRVSKTKEWWLNDRIADRLETLLGYYDCEVLRVDDTTGLTDVSLANRVRKANKWGADVYISIHHDAGVNGRSGGGTTVHYYPSGNCKDLANRMYNHVVKKTLLVGDRYAKIVSSSGLYVLRKTKMPSFLLENGFIDSAVDEPIVLTSEHAEKTAQGLLNFLVSEYCLKKIKSENGANNAVSTSFKVKVKVPSLNYRAGAGTSFEIRGAIKDRGIYTIVQTATSVNGSTWGLLKSGAGWINISNEYVTRV
jgi:N-acetylmuramoyl-L-alanine amidase